MPAPQPKPLGIASVERETGLSKDTLRVWERRYGFPTPERDETGERSYPAGQVEKLRLIRKLMDRGYRPGKLVGEELAVLRTLATGEPAQEAWNDELAQLAALCKAHRIEELRRELSQSILRKGMARFVVEVLAPLTTLVGTEWENGRLAVFEEHLYTEAVQAVMRQAIAAMPLPMTRADTLGPTILLTTIPRELHALGLLMAESLFALEQARCISLGVQTPIADIVQAAVAQRADIVALSFSASSPAAHVLQSLADLRAALPESIEIWTGGRCAILDRRPPSSITHLDLHDIPAALSAWRLRAGTR